MILTPASSRIYTTNTQQNAGEAKVTPIKPRPSLATRVFWTCRGTWKRAGVNTLRCLVGCTIGDFSALWTLQTHAPELGMSTIMALSMTSGLTTSIALETALLHRGKDKLSTSMAFKTAMGMSFISMLAMELAENAVDYHLTGGVVALQDPRFWTAAVVSIAAGYLVPLPWNYYRLRRWGKACH
ncbi:hypothetical protein AUEXF2481DRAFT_448780 [Aureobasidium subglaciale EXF-2481]|uniref:DUF4396 domain-containing protein n=1 Tax=Aureobasidium subglaciale (strain EXF-2481) TaxID=1043005 RepID=A0A074Y7F0_AURSE|nr:uncharacterized protein AUEXF2481DRAFT_448780 [Aureobasidium subglaciale EXF-2481]KEQ91919.1 hypothetical protein AUEXF2481DRAFT_448780 [Aureobasidium subglaciale EXF-2481]